MIGVRYSTSEIVKLRSIHFCLPKSRVAGRACGGSVRICVLPFDYSVFIHNYFEVWTFSVFRLC